jgi:peroxiredoxin Q/BCP
MRTSMAGSPPPTRGGRGVVKEGQKAPEFDLPSSDGGRVRLTDLKGQALVLYFYPRDSTPGCTREACGFRDSLATLKKRGVAILGVSPDSLAAHAKFKEKYRLNFPLLSDQDRAVAKAYGAFGAKVSYGKKILGMIRSTFVIDAGGVVRKVFPRVKVDGHVEEVIEVVRTLRA